MFTIGETTRTGLTVNDLLGGGRIVILHRRPQPCFTFARRQRVPPIQETGQQHQDKGGDSERVFHVFWTKSGFGLSRHV